MGLIGRIFGGREAVATLGTAVVDMAGAFTPNATRAMELSHAAYAASLGEYGTEFRHPRPGRFDLFVNGLNRLPRPFLAFGTLGLFTYAMIDPAGFAQRMAGLAFVPEPLWWLLGAIVGFYFGAREAHYLRARVGEVPVATAAPQTGRPPADNPALAEIRERGRDR